MWQFMWQNWRFLGDKYFKLKSCIHESMENENSRVMVVCQCLAAGGFIFGDINIAPHYEYLLGDSTWIYLSCWNWYMMNQQFLSWCYVSLVSGLLANKVWCHWLLHGWLKSGDHCKIFLQWIWWSFGGCIWACDWWMVKIKIHQRVTQKEDRILLHQKGSMEENVQVIVSHEKSFCLATWHTEGSSMILLHSKMVILVNDSKNWMSLCYNGFYFLHESVYALKSYLVTPYGNAIHGTKHDNFNFFHSL